MAKTRQRKTWTHDRFTDDAGVEWNVHKRAVCQGSNCTLHNPSVHPLSNARIVLRTDPFRYGFAERICEHDIGHPDPDSVAFYDSIGQDGWGTHGCDRCCTGKYKEVQDCGLVIPVYTDYCGAWYDCDLPRGHNMGKADIPENHNGKRKSSYDNNCTTT